MDRRERLKGSIRRMDILQRTTYIFWFLAAVETTGKNIRVQTLMFGF